MQFHYLTDMATPSKEPLPRGLDIYKFCRPFLGHHYYTLSLYGPCIGVEKKIRFAPKLPPLGVGGHEIFNFLATYPTDATYQIWLRLTQ